MNSSHANCHIGHTIKTTAVLGEVVDVQLREAAWSSMARLRQLACPAGSLVALRRSETFLAGNMAGLAGVFNTRLAVRLTHLLHAPQDLATESFVAGFLLVRCDRVRQETQVMTAWQHAPCAETQAQLCLALIHTGIVQPTNQNTLRAAMCSHDAALRRSASSIVLAMRLNVDAQASTLHASARHDVQTARTLLELMAQDLLAAKPDAIAEALQSGDAELRHSAERVLFAHAPFYLAQRARSQLEHGDNPSLLGLEAMALMMLAPHPEAAADLTRLRQASQLGRLGPLAVHALGLTGLPSAALMLLQLLAQSDAPQMPEAILEAFGAITGVEACSSEHTLWQEAQGHLGVARTLQRAWGRGNAAAHDATLFGRSPTAAHLIGAIETMQVGRWQSLLRLLHARSHRQVVIDPWALLEQQIQQIIAQKDAVNHAFGPHAKGLRQSMLGAAMSGLHLAHRTLPCGVPA